MAEIIKLQYNNRTLRFPGNTGYIGYVKPPQEYDVTVVASQYGTVTAQPSRGISGTTITLSASASSGYELDYFTVNGVSILGNTFTLTGNTTVEGVFKQALEPLPHPDWSTTTVNGITVTSENVNLDDGLGGIETLSNQGYYTQVISNYYTWDAAQRIASRLPGWHILTKAEFNTFCVIGTNGEYNSSWKTASRYDWKVAGYDTLGFHAQPTGMVDNGSSGTIINKTYGCYWFDDEDDTDSTKGKRYYVGNSNNSQVTHWGSSIKGCKLCLRLVKES
jgi:hypothetical protein